MLTIGSVWTNASGRVRYQVVAPPLGQDAVDGMVWIQLLAGHRPHTPFQTKEHVIVELLSPVVPAVPVVF